MVTYERQVARARALADMIEQERERILGELEHLTGHPTDGERLCRFYDLVEIYASLAGADLGASTRFGIAASQMRGDWLSAWADLPERIRERSDYRGAADAVGARQS